MYCAAFACPTTGVFDGKTGPAATPPASPRTRPFLQSSSPTSAHRSSFERRRPGGKGKAHTSDQCNAEGQIQSSQFTHREQVCKPSRRSGDDVDMQEIAGECYTCRCRRDVQSAKGWGNSRRDDSRRHAHYKNHQTPRRRHTSVIAPDAVGLRAQHPVRRSVHRAPRGAGATTDPHEDADRRRTGDHPRPQPTLDARCSTRGRRRVSHARAARPRTLGSGGVGGESTRRQDRECERHIMNAPAGGRARSRNSLQDPEVTGSACRCCCSPGRSGRR